MTVETGIQGPVERARHAWGAALPAWVEGLARACAETSQNRVAKRLGVSASLISQVIKRTYPADLARIEDIYRGVYEAATVDCPALGTIGMDRCRLWRSRAGRLNTANTLNVTMFRACNSCPLHNGEEEQ
ncbi:hypothetical protein [Litorisediminicola beolgyonensis]|uniref:Transcriptional regulator n=1 Tax=Litorisediminicola beolgyonensis TaxID=1173614 RepID=A0ABW3ZIC5_9RHOB